MEQKKNSTEREGSGKTKNGTAIEKLKAFQEEVSLLDDKTSFDISNMTLSAEAKNCYTKFENVINAYPQVIQKEIVLEFIGYLSNGNVNKDLCCRANSIIRRVSPKINQITKLFSNLISKQEQECKNGFACFRGNEVILKAFKRDIQSNYRNENQEKLKNLLLKGKVQNSNLVKCLIHIGKVSSRNIGLICADDDMISKTFIYDDMKKISKPKKYPDDDLEFFNQCSDYVINFNKYPEEITNAFIDSLNFLIKSDQCNYFSDYFDGDRKPRDSEKLSNKQKNHNKPGKNSTDFNSTVYQSRVIIPQGDKTQILINKWYTCAKNTSEMDQNYVDHLNEVIPKILLTNPRGYFAGHVRGLNLKEITQKFNLLQNPRFIVKCASKVCTQEGKISSNFNSTNVVFQKDITFDYSCCDDVCLMKYFNSNVTAQSEPLMPLEFLQTNQEKTSNLFKNKTEPIESFAEVIQIKYHSEFEIPFNQNLNTKLKSYEKCSNISHNSIDFNDASLSNKISNFLQNPSNFENDSRLKLSLFLNTKSGSASITPLHQLIDQLRNRTSRVFLSCEDGVCKVQEANQPEQVVFDLIADENYTNFIKENEDQTENIILKDGRFNHTRNDTTETNKTNNLFKKSGKINKGNNADFFYRPIYKDLDSNWTVDTVTDDGFKNIKRDISKLLVKSNPNFNQTEYAVKQNQNVKSLSVQFECCDYFCVLIIRNSNDTFPLSPNKSRLYIEFSQKKDYLLDTSNLGITQKKCIVKNTLINGKNKDLDSLDNNQMIDEINTLDKCGILSPYTKLPISSDCLNILVGHCQKNNFFDLYNRYTKGIASSDDLPSSSSFNNTCQTPNECYALKSDSAESAKRECGKALQNLIMTNGVRISFEKFSTPCNGSVPTSSIEPISFVGIKSKTKMRNTKEDTHQINTQSDTINMNELNDSQKAELLASTTVAKETSDTSISIDGVTQEPSSISVEADLGALNNNVDSTSTSIEPDSVTILNSNSVTSSNSNSVEPLKLGYGVLLLLVTFLI